MERKQATTTFFLLALSALALYFCYVIARPFLSPAFLAVMIAIVGSAAVWGPAVIILVIGRHWWKALIFLGWGAGVVGQIDTLVRPYVISGRVKLHTLLIRCHGALHRPGRSLGYARSA